MDILIINNERENFAGKRISWDEHVFRFSSAGWEDIATGFGRRDIPIRINRSALDRLISEIQQAGAVYCETPEALLLWYVAEQRGLKRIPFVVEDEDILKSAGMVGDWIADVYGHNPLPDFLACPVNILLHHVDAQRKDYIAKNVDHRRLFHLPCSSYYIKLIDPEAYSRFVNYRMRRLHGESREFRGSIICPGFNNRDFSTFTQAVCDIKYKCIVISHRSEMQTAESINPAWRAAVPFDLYLDIINAADIIVVPLLNEAAGGGENTISFAMALSKPVVATKTLSTSEIISHEENGLLVPPGDPAAIHDAIIRLKNDARLRKKLGAAACTAEKKLAAKTEKTLIKTFENVSVVKIDAQNT